jgi:hypothetical protein
MSTRKRRPARRRTSGASLPIPGSPERPARDDGRASPHVRVLVISGAMGAGKTTALGEASDILSAHGIAHAAIDLDCLGVAGFSDAVAQKLMARNLAAVWRNFADAGITRILIAEALERMAQRKRIAAAIPDAELIVCRLIAPLDTMQARIRAREPGLLQEHFVARCAQLEATLDARRVEDFSVDNGGSSITDVAREMLVRARWIDA